jgi:hypothetical protein
VIGLDPDCHYGDHDWAGGGVCIRCGKELRCYCGRFIREDQLDAHVEKCPWVLAHADEEERAVA